MLLLNLADRYLQFCFPNSRCFGLHGFFYLGLKDSRFLIFLCLYKISGSGLIPSGGGLAVCLVIWAGGYHLRFSSSLWLYFVLGLTSGGKYLRYLLFFFPFLFCCLARGGIYGMIVYRLGTLYCIVVLLL